MMESDPFKLYSDKDNLFLLEESFKAYLLCHSTKSKFDQNMPSILNHRTERKEHASVLKFCKELGFSFEGSLKISSEMINAYKIQVLNFHEFYPILSINEYSEKRKRFSILVGEKYSLVNDINNSNATLYVWSNDLNSLINNLEMRENFKEEIRENTNLLKEKGFQIIFYCKKEISAEEKLQFLSKKKSKESHNFDSSSELDELYDEFEKNLEFLSGIYFEYELKPNVIETLNVFKEAKIKLHIVSEDNEEKVMAIAYKSQILNPSSNIKKLIATNDENLTTMMKYILNNIKKELHHFEEANFLNKNEKNIKRRRVIKQSEKLKKNERYILIIDGKTLQLILESKTHTNNFNFLIMLCAHFIGFNLLPSQKKLLITLLNTVESPKYESNIIAIGNNDSDYTMLQEANISIEIHDFQMERHLNGDIYLNSFEKIHEVLLVSSSIGAEIIKNIVCSLLFSGQVFLFSCFVSQISSAETDISKIKPIYFTLLMKNWIVLSIVVFLFMETSQKPLMLQMIAMLHARKITLKINPFVWFFSKICLPSILTVFLFNTFLVFGYTSGAFYIKTIEQYQFEFFLCFSVISYLIVLIFYIII